MKSGSSSIRQTWVTIFIICAGLIFTGWITGSTFIFWCAMAILIISGLSSQLRNWIHKNWMLLAAGMSKISTPILLTVIYIAVLCPVAFLYRLLRKKDALRLKNEDESLFCERNAKIDKDAFKNPW